MKLQSRYRFLVSALCAAAIFVSIGARLLAQDVNMATTPEDRDIDRFRQQSARMAEGNVDLLMVGDSITQGWEGAGAATWENFYSARNAMNFGISGDRTGHVLWRIDHSPMEKISPKLAVMMIGTNNIGHGSSSSAQTVEGIERIIEKFQSLYPSMKILLVEVFPRDEFSDGKLRVAVNEINAGLEARYADGKVENVTLLNLGGLFLDADGRLPAPLMPDFLHPNSAGYEIWAAAMEPSIASLLGDMPAESVAAPRNQENWWQNRYQEKAARVEAGNIDLLLIGDSITHGWEGVPDLWERYYADKNGINMGIGGDRTSQVLWRLENYAMEKIDPKGAVLLIGVNNLAGGNEPKNVAVGIRKIVDVLKSKCPNIKIIVLKVFPWGNAAEYAKKQGKVDALNAMLPSMLHGVSNVKIIDLNPKFLDVNGTLTEAVMPDLLHPNHFGYEIWGNALDAEVKKLLE